jgi:hypothetical protein
MRDNSKDYQLFFVVTWKGFQSSCFGVAKRGCLKKGSAVFVFFGDVDIISRYWNWRLQGCLYNQGQLFLLTISLVDACYGKI